MNTLNDEQNFERAFRKAKFEQMKWSHDEDILIINRNRRKVLYPKYQLNFSDGFNMRLRKSVFGEYVDTFNRQQNQDSYLNENKLLITNYQMKHLTSREKEEFEKNNSLFDDSLDLLIETINRQEIVENEYVRKTLEELRLLNFYIKQIDYGLRNFVNLQVLILAGNNIRDIEGRNLPRGLMFLELYNNFIQSVQNLVKMIPKSIIHLGLGRNCLTDDNSSHLTERSKRLGKLISLDLSENSFCNLSTILEAAKKLPSLRALQLEGNPCYVYPCYKEEVFANLPSIRFLDSIAIPLSKDKSEDTSYDKDLEPKLIFICYRVMGLKRPPKDKKRIQTIHIEVEFPLLEEAHVMKVQKDFKKVDAAVEAPPSKGKKKNKVPKNPSPYDAADEYDAEREAQNYSFKTEKKSWSKIMEFPPINIDPPQKNMFTIRDTLKSRVTVRVVYLKVLPAALAKKKGKKDRKHEKSTGNGGKNSKKEKKSLKDKGKKDNGDKSDITAEVNTEEYPPHEKPKDEIVKMVTLCTFDCDLDYVSWDNEMVDFYWANHSKIGSNALRVNGCLKKLEYVDKMPKKGPESKSAASMRSEVEICVVPKIFTCQVGFGLKRNISAAECASTISASSH